MWRKTCARVWTDQSNCSIYFPLFNQLFLFLLSLNSLQPVWFIQVNSIIFLVALCLYSRPLCVCLPNTGSNGWWCRGHCIWPRWRLCTLADVNVCVTVFITYQSVALWVRYTVLFTATSLAQEIDPTQLLNAKVADVVNSEQRMITKYGSIVYRDGHGT